MQSSPHQNLPLLYFVKCQALRTQVLAFKRSHLSLWVRPQLGAVAALMPATSLQLYPYLGYGKFFYRASCLVKVASLLNGEVSLSALVAPLLSVSSPSPLRLLSVSSPSSLLHPTAGWRKDDRNLHRTRTPRCELDSAAQATKFSSVAAGLCRLNDAPAKVAVHEKISAADQCVLCWHDCAWCFDGADGEKTAHKARH